MSKQSAFFASRILGHKLLSGASRTARRRRSAGFQARLEPLESRHLLAANILAEISSTVDGSSNSRDIDLTVSLPDATSSNATAMLMIRAMAADGSAFDPGAPVVVGKTSSDSVSTLASHDDVDGTAGVTMVQISAGDFTLQFAGDGDAATTGGFTAQVFLVGDVMNADGIVTQDEHTLATAALIQTLGTGNFVTQLFYESLGIDLSQDLYDAGMDGDGNGEIGPADLEAIEHNLGVGMVQVELQSDADAPVISGLALQNDTGVSNTDRITTNPTVVATVSDESEIASLLAGVNAAPTVDILSSLNTTNGILTLDRAALETINGGTLVDGSVTLQLLATDALGNAMATPATLTFTLITTNQSPISAGIADQTATEDQAFTQNLSAIFSDPNTGDQLTLSVGTLPAWLSFNATTRTLSGTPANGDVGTTSITVTATDSQGATASSTYDLTVVNVNDAPVISALDNQTVNEDATRTFSIAGKATDVDANDTVTLTAQQRVGTNLISLPAWLTFNASTGVFTATPANADVGVITVRVTATDLAGATDTEEFTVTVVNVNDVPTLVTPIGDQLVDQDEAFTLNITNNFDDVDAGDTLTFTASLNNGGALPTWLSFSNGVFSGTPDNGDVGTFDVRVIATDGTGASVSDVFNVEVANLPDPPTLVTPIPDRNAPEDATTVVDLNDFFVDPDVGDTITFNAELVGGGDFPSWMSFNAATGQLTFTPTNDDVGESVNIRVTAEDTTNLQTTDTFVVTVQNVNDAPTLVNPIPDQTVNQNASFSLNVSTFFADIDPGDTLTFTGTVGTNSLPAWLSLNGSTGILSGTPGNADVGTISVTITARDSANATVSDTFTLEVVDVNDAPVIANQSFNLSADATNGTVVGTIAASDPDNDNLSIAILSGNGAGAFALNGFQLTVADAAQLSEGATFTLQVQVTDDGTPVLSTNATITVNVSQNTPPNAVNDPATAGDPAFETKDSSILEILVADILANDTDADGDTITLDSVQGTSAQGAAVSISTNDSSQPIVVYDPTQVVNILSLRPGEELTDTFTYTISDGQGGTDTATVSVHVIGVDDVKFTYVVTDTSGNALTQIQTNQAFELQIFVEDLRDNPEWVFTAYADVSFQAALASVSGSAQFENPYTFATVIGTSTPGLLDEVGALALSQPSSNPALVVTVPFTASGTPGTLTFTGAAATDQFQHIISLKGEDGETNPVRVDFGELSIPIVGTGAAQAESTDKVYEPTDVNHDGVTNPLDALAVINTLGRSSLASAATDVNRDGVTNPLDALAVVNYLDQLSRASRNPQPAMSASAVVVSREANESTTISPAALLSSEPSTTIRDEVFEAFALEGEDSGMSESGLLDTTKWQRSSNGGWARVDQAATEAVDLSTLELDEPL